MCIYVNMLPLHCWAPQPQTWRVQTKLVHAKVVLRGINSSLRCKTRKKCWAKGGDAPASQWRPPPGSIEVVETKRMNHYDSLIWLDAYGFDGFECIFQRYPLKLHFWMQLKQFRPKTERLIQMARLEHSWGFVAVCGAFAFIVPKVQNFLYEGSSRKYDFVDACATKMLW